MKKIIVIAGILFTCHSIQAQQTLNNKRLSVAQQGPVGQIEVKDKADVLYGKTQQGQQKDLIFRQSVLDETTKTTTGDNADLKEPADKPKLLNNTVIRSTKSTPNN